MPCGETKVDSQRTESSKLARIEGWSHGATKMALWEIDACRNAFQSSLMSLTCIFVNKARITMAYCTENLAF